MTPRGLVEQADLKAASKALADDIAALGPPTGWIVVCERAFAWWCDQPMTYPVPDPDAPPSRTHAPSGRLAERESEGANQESPPF